MTRFTFARLSEFLNWAESAESDLIGRSGLAEDFANLKRATGRGRLEAQQIETLNTLANLVADEVPAEYSGLLTELSELSKSDAGQALAKAAQKFAAEYPGFSPAQNGSSSGAVVPLIDDPRAIYLPALGSAGDKAAFINGYDAVTRKISIMTPVLDAAGLARILVEVVDAESGEKTALRDLGECFYAEGATRFFASSRFEEASIYGVTFDASGRAVKMERYPSYSAAGFVAPFKRSVLVSAVQRDKPKQTYIAKVFTSEREYVDLKIFEDDKGGIVKIAYKDFSRGELEKCQDRLFEQECWAMPEENLKIAFKKVPVGGGRAAYRISVYHDSGRAEENRVRSKRRLKAVEVFANNADWRSVIDAHVTRLTTELTSGRMEPEDLRDELYRIRDEESLKIVSEVSDRLTRQDETQMFLINMYRLPETVGLPVPLDSRVFPGSTELMTELVDYFSYGTVRGFVSRRLLEAAREVARFAEIPARFIEGLWLFATNPTESEMAFLRRGASTPAELKSGYPVAKYRRILNESYSPLADTAASREEQRRHIVQMLAGDGIGEGLRQYLGYQFVLAENFDLMLLESGMLYYNNNLVHVINVSEDGNYLRVIADDTRKIIDIPQAKMGPRADPKAFEIDKKFLEGEVKMAPHHDDDPFLFTFRDLKKDRVVGNGGTFGNGNMLMRGANGLYSVPTPAAVRDSMAGLLPLPLDYLSQILPNKIPDDGKITWTQKPPVVYDLEKHGFGLEGVDFKDHPPLKMIRYDVQIGDFTLEVYLPQPHSQLCKTLRKLGYYVAGEEDLGKIVKYYLAVTKEGFRPTRANIFLMPGLVTRAEKGSHEKRRDGHDHVEDGFSPLTQQDGGILGFYTWKTEDLVISSDVVGADNSFERWAAVRLFNTARHEIAHSIKRGNPWITSLTYRAMALDGFSMDYGKTHLEEYFAVLAQHFFDHPIHAKRFPNGYRLLYTLIKLKEAGVSWDGPNHNQRLDDPTDLPVRERNIDGTYGALRALALGLDPFEMIRAAKAKDSGGNSGGGNLRFTPARPVLLAQSVPPSPLKNLMSTPSFTDWPLLPTAPVALAPTIDVDAPSLLPGAILSAPLLLPFAPALMRH